VNVLELLAKICAIVAGLLITVITLMTCVSLIGRNTIGWTIVGDFELSGAAAGAAIALFLPWCQVRRECRAGPHGSVAVRGGAGLDGLAHGHRGLERLDQPVDHDDDGLSRMGGLRVHGAAAGAVRRDRPGSGGDWR
jgi:hypothetical protein